MSDQPVFVCDLTQPTNPLNHVWEASAGSGHALSLQEISFRYFTEETNSANGLIADKTVKDSPASIAACGFGLSGFTIGVKRGLIDRQEAVQRTLALLRFLWNAPQGREIENYLSDQIWSLMRGCAPLRNGLRKAGFKGGWLED